MVVNSPCGSSFSIQAFTLDLEEPRNLTRTALRPSVLTWKLRLTLMRLHQKDQPKNNPNKKPHNKRAAKLGQETTHRGKPVSWWIHHITLNNEVQRLSCSSKWTHTHVWTVPVSRLFYNRASKLAAEQQRGLMTHLQMEHKSTNFKASFLVSWWLVRSGELEESVSVEHQMKPSATMS